MTRRQDEPTPPCQECGQPKPGGRGRKLCDACRDKRKPLLEKEAGRRKGARAKAARADEGRTRVTRKGQGPEGTSWCSRCQQYLAIAEFPVNNSRPSGLNAYCRPCYSQVLHTRRLRQEFDMTSEEYAEMLAAQDGRCAICMATPRTRRLAVDHNHKTGEVRGLLCTRCNHKVLGAARENPNILRRAAEYLERTLLQPPETAPTSNFGREVEAFLDSRMASLAGIEVEYKARLIKSDFEDWARDVQRRAIMTGRYRWAMFIRRKGHGVRDAYVVMPLWLMVDLLADDVPPVSEQAS